MKILRVFPRQTSFTPRDKMAFVGDPPLPIFQPEADEVHVSVTFTWDREEGRRLAEAWNEHYPVVKLGGPAFDACPSGFMAGRYVKPGVTFTTRGCNNNCPWCFVPRREGQLVEYEEFAPGNIIQDNNILQASRAHLRRVFAMLKTQRAAVFSGGLEARLIDDWLVEQLQNIKVDQLFLAADTGAALKPLEKALNKLSVLGRRKLRVYTMIGYGGESIDAAAERLRAVWQLGGLPFAQLYQPPDRLIDYSHEWKRLARTFSRPAATFAAMRSGGR